MDSPRITLSVSGGKSVGLRVGGGESVALSVAGISMDGGIPYDGPYTVRPSPNSQTLPTAQRRMRYDVEVEQIPYSAATNESGGYTVSIAS